MKILLRMASVITLTLIPVVSFAQYQWYVDPELHLPANSVIDDLVAGSAPVAHFDLDWDVPSGDPPRVAGENVAGSFDMSGSGSFQIGEGPISINFGADIDYMMSYRIVVQPTSDPDQFIVAMEWKRDGLYGWSNESIVQLFRVDRDDPTTPIFPPGTPTTYPSTGGDQSGVYDDDNLNGLDDYFDAQFDSYYQGAMPDFNEWYDDDLYEVIIGESVYLDWFDGLMRDLQSEYWNT